MVTGVGDGAMTVSAKAAAALPAKDNDTSFSMMERRNALLFVALDAVFDAASSGVVCFLWGGSSLEHLLSLLGDDSVGRPAVAPVTVLAEATATSPAEEDETLFMVL